MLNQSAKERVARRAGSQFGRISWAQLVALGADRRTIHDWTQTSYLHRVLPGVYAVGHAAPSTEADLAAAVLYAGPGAMLSHATAAWWLGLVDAQPRLIEVSTPRRCLSRRGIHVHQRRTIDRIWRRRLPVTSLVQTLIDYASAAPRIKLRRALAQVDYHQGVDVAAIEAGLGQGRLGSKTLRAAIKEHQPRLALTKSGLEVIFFELCEAEDLPLPEINAKVMGWEVDALWRQERVAVEVDGPGNHRTPGQIRRDRRKEFELRAANITLLRYSDDQVRAQRPAVAAEIRAALIPPARSA